MRHGSLGLALHGKEPRDVPTWVYVAVAVSIALVALGIGQATPGAGIVFVARASTVWTVYAVSRQRQLRRGG